MQYDEELKEGTYDLSCPVCLTKLPGYYFEHEICPNCNWEDDPSQTDEPDELGANGNLTFRQAVENYRKSGKIKG